MPTRSPQSPSSLSQRALAQRRLRRSAAQRQLCSTNGCATFLVVDAGLRRALCPVCGYARRVPAASGPSVVAGLAPR